MQLRVQSIMTSLMKYGKKFCGHNFPLDFATEQDDILLWDNQLLILHGNGGE